MRAPRPRQRGKSPRVPGPPWSKTQTHLPAKSGYPWRLLDGIILGIPSGPQNNPIRLQGGHLADRDTRNLLKPESPRGSQVLWHENRPQCLGEAYGRDPLLPLGGHAGCAARGKETLHGEGMMREGDSCFLSSSWETKQKKLLNWHHLKSCLSLWATVSDPLQAGEGLFPHF